ncbi:MAG TPA: cytochrome c maturation protein CcmE [Acidimicrobiales bacterium]|nr:cytochrome c maturation protein CcmE [Acidimicrobiales bacterium]
MTTTEHAAGARVLPPPPPAAPRGRSALRRRLIVVFVVLLGAMGFLLYKTLTSAVVYFKTADQAIAARASLGSSTFDIEGVVVKGSLVTTDDALRAFTISSGRARVRVENAADPPQLFTPNVPVVLVGHFEAHSDVFDSVQILVKHSNSYIAAHPGRVRAPNGSVR